MRTQSIRRSIIRDRRLPTTTVHAIDTIVAEMTILSSLEGDRHSRNVSRPPSKIDQDPGGGPLSNRGSAVRSATYLRRKGILSRYSSSPQSEVRAIPVSLSIIARSGCVALRVGPMDIERRREWVRGSVSMVVPVSSPLHRQGRKAHASAVLTGGGESQSRGAPRRPWGSFVGLEPFQVPDPACHRSNELL
jgi:hypothetical protein